MKLFLIQYIEAWLCLCLLDFPRDLPCEAVSMKDQTEYVKV